MRFSVGTASTRYRQLQNYAADWKPGIELKNNIAAVKELIRCAKNYNVNINFNRKAGRRNPGIYANPVCKAPEVSV